MADRKYNCKDVDMLVASNVVVGNFEQYKDQLIAKRKTWADPFAVNLEEKIGNTLDILGINTRVERTSVTRQLIKTQNLWLEKLATFKIQLEVDFEDDPAKLRDLAQKLGFSRQYSQVKSGNQEALIQLLTTFKQNMSTEVRQEIEGAGMDGEIIDELIAMNDEINEMNIKQETLKGNTPKDTVLHVDEMNATYKDVIGICKIAPRLLDDVPTATADFSYNRILNRLH